MTEEELATLMVKVTDDTASPAERERLMAHLDEHPDLQEELQMHRALKAVTDGWVHRLELDLIEDRNRERWLPRLFTGLGLTLLLGGFAVLLGGGLVEVFLDPEAPLWVKVGFGGSAAGSFVLLVSAVAWRFSTSKHDRYSEVIR